MPAAVQRSTICPSRQRVCPIPTVYLSLEKRVHGIARRVQPGCPSGPEYRVSRHTFTAFRIWVAPPLRGERLYQEPVAMEVRCTRRIRVAAVTAAVGTITVARTSRCR